jgi:hypothetical protein
MIFDLVIALAYLGCGMMAVDDFIMSSRKESRIFAAIAGIVFFVCSVAWFYIAIHG